RRRLRRLARAHRGAAPAHPPRGQHPVPAGLQADRPRGDGPPGLLNRMSMDVPATTLTDRFGRRHDYLRISLTERCNMRCTYCMPEEGIPLRPREQFMRQQEVLAIAEVFAGLGVRKVRLTG